MSRLILSVAVVSAAGCAAVPSSAPTIDGTRWQVAQINGRATPPSELYRISFVNGQIGARFGCNQMGGGYRQRGNVIQAGQMATTLMGCPEPAGTFEAQAGAILGQPMMMSWGGTAQLRLANAAGSIDLVRAN